MRAHLGWCSVCGHGTGADGTCRDCGTVAEQRAFLAEHPAPRWDMPTEMVEAFAYAAQRIRRSSLEGLELQRAFLAEPLTER